jgi:putative two-component system response regulator
MDPNLLSQARILIIDDEEVNLQLLTKILNKAGYCNIMTSCDSSKALSLFLEFKPDIMMLDLMMNPLTGFDIMAQIKPYIPEESYFPILILTGDSSVESRRKALSQGASDFLTKPFDMPEVILRTKNMLKTRTYYLELRNQNQDLENKVCERTRELEEARLEILKRLALAVEYRDDDTGEHTIRVGANCACVARGMGFPADLIELVKQAAPLHDIGKVGISDAIVLKPQKLTPEEFEVMKTHTLIGGQILSESRFSVLQIGEKIARSHHERWDGRGYPEGLQSETIPLEARITSVVDVFDALTHERPYKHAWPVEDAIGEILRCSGTNFDPAVVEAFLAEHSKGSIMVNVDDFENGSYEERR